MAPSIPEVERREPRCADLSLIQRVRAGDASALDELLADHWTDLVAYATRILDSPDAAEDVAQETFIRVWERRQRIHPTGSLRPFLYRIARNLALNRSRRLRIRAEWRSNRTPVYPSATGPAQIAEHNELKRAADRAIDALPERRREVFVLARYHDLSYREIAHVMKISPQTVANQMSAALAELREALEPFIREPAVGTRERVQEAVPEPRAPARAI